MAHSGNKHALWRLTGRQNAVLRFRFSSQGLSIFCENAVQRAVKVYSEVEKIKVNTEY